MRFRLPRITDAKDHILTAILLVIAVSLIIGRSASGLNNLRKVSITLFSYLEEPLSNVRVYRQALKTNTYLRKQNVLLLDKLSRLRAAGQQNKKLRQLLQFSSESNLSLFPVQIVGKELNQVTNSMTLDAGKEEGIEEGMPVISAEGLVGKVILTAQGYSQVMPFFNTLFRVSAKIEQSNAYGIVSWDGKPTKRLQLKYIPQTVEVDTGATIVTSGYSNKFPPDIPIGKVIKVEPEQGKETQKIYLRPLVNLYELAEGFVVKFQPDTTVQTLNEKYEKLFK